MSAAVLGPGRSVESQLGHVDGDILRLRQEEAGEVEVDVHRVPVLAEQEADVLGKIACGGTRDPSPLGSLIVTCSRYTCPTHAYTRQTPAVSACRPSV